MAERTSKRRAARNHLGEKAEAEEKGEAEGEGESPRISSGEDRRPGERERRESRGEGAG
jgi:hypothetical protein